MDHVEQRQVTVHAEFGETDAQFAATGLREVQIGGRLVEVSGPKLTNRKVVDSDHSVVLCRRRWRTGRVVQQPELFAGSVFGVGRVHDSGVRNSQGADQALGGHPIRDRNIIDQVRHTLAFPQHRDEFVTPVVADGSGQQGVGGRTVHGRGDRRL